MLGVVMLSGFLGAGTNNVAMSVVFKPISEDLGWSRSLVAGAVALGTIGAGVLAPMLGRLADRIGPRVLVPVGSVLVAGLLFGLSLVREPWQFYAAYIPARAFAQTLLFGVVPLTAVANWFYLMRPRAIGLFAMSIPFGAAVIALLNQVLVESLGWRSTFIALGVLLVLLVLVPAAVFLRRRPEDVGLRPDGALAPAATTTASSHGPRPSAPTEEPQWPFSAAARTSALWLVVIASLLYTTASGGTAFNLAAYLTDVGIEPVVAALSVSIFAMSGAIASGFWGFLAEKMPVRLLNVLSLLLSAAGLVLLLQVRAPLLAIVFAILYGATARGQEALLQILLAHYFGRRSFGSISGVMELALRIGLGAGPFIGALVFDLTGSYELAFQGFMALFVIAGLLVAIARQPRLAPAG